jgi:hypothetical protein
MIKFPKVHIAASVLNRILNARDELNGSGPPAGGQSPQQPPVVPDPALMGAVIDQQIATPPPVELPPLEPPPEPAPDELAGIVARGDDLISA